MYYFFLFQFIILLNRSSSTGSFSFGFFHKNRCFRFEWQRLVLTRLGVCCRTAIDVIFICGRFTRFGADVAQLLPLHGVDVFFKDKLWRFCCRLSGLHGVSYVDLFGKRNEHFALNMSVCFSAHLAAHCFNFLIYWIRKT